MKKRNFAKLVLCLVMIVATVLTVVSCAKDSKNYLSGEYYYDNNNNGRSEGDIKLTFSEEKVTVVTYVANKNSNGGFSSSYYDSVKESDPIKGTYKINGNRISFEFDSYDYDDLPELLKDSESLYFEKEENLVSIGYKSFEATTKKSDDVGDKILDKIKSSPALVIIPIVIVAGIIIIALSSGKKKKSNKNNNAGGNAYTPDIGDVDKVEIDFGYYRYQEDNQIVVKRTEEQQRIVDEYFVVKNIKTTTCDSSLKKKAKLFGTISSCLLILGVIVAVGGFIVEIPALGVLGIAAAIGGIVCKIISNQTMKNFEESIKVTVAPRKLMTDAEFEALVDKKIESMDIAQLGLDRLGLDSDQVKEIRPIVLRDKVINNRSFTVRNKENRSVHSSTQYVTYLYFTDEQLFVYKIQFDMCCNMQEEWTSEFFYKDICDVSSYTSRNILTIGDIKFEYSTVSFNIIASNSQIGFEIDGDNENVGSIQAMKQKIREKKAQ